MYNYIIFIYNIHFFLFFQFFKNRSAGVSQKANGSNWCFLASLQAWLSKTVRTQVTRKASLASWPRPRALILRLWFQAQSTHYLWVGWPGRSHPSNQLCSLSSSSFGQLKYNNILLLINNIDVGYNVDIMIKELDNECQNQKHIGAFPVPRSGWWSKSHWMMDILMFHCKGLILKRLFGPYINHMYADQAVFSVKCKKGNRALSFL